MSLPAISLAQIHHWLQVMVGSIGGLGLFVAAFLDSSVLTFPVINDLLVIELAVKNPLRMPYYALMATLGSVAGCVALYFVAKKGGEAMFHRHAGPHAEKVIAWLKRNEFLSVLVAALLPPPTPFKFFVLAAGVCELPVRTFTLALLVARSLRYFGIGFLAVRYGPVAGRYMVEHKLRFAFGLLAVVLLSYWLSHFFLRSAHRQR